MTNEVIIINKVMKSKEAVSEMIKDLNIYFYDNIGEKGCFEKQITFKFNKKDLYRHKLNINRFLIQMILWEALAGRGVKLDKKFLCKNIDCITNDDIADYYNEFNISYFEKDTSVDIIEINEMIASSQERLKKLAEDFSMILGLSVSVRGIIDLCENDEEVNDLIVNYTPPHNVSTREIEDHYNEHGEKLLKALAKSDSVYKPLLSAKEGIRTKQLLQFLQCVGFQSNLDGYTYPTPIESGYVNKGLQTPSEYLLDATMGNKAQIYTKVYTGNSGYFSKRSTHAALDSLLNKDPNYDCKTHSSNLIEVFVKDKGYLKINNGFQYKEKRNSLAYKTIDVKDKEQVKKLVGTTIYLRTPLVCASKNGICHKCYGRLSRVNSRKHVGIHSSETISSRIMQSILSTKHLLFTVSSSIEFGDSIKDLFTVDANAIIFDPSGGIKLKGKNALFIRYYEDDLIISDTDDEEDGVSYVKSISKFEIVTQSGEKVLDIQEEGGLELYLTPAIENNIKHKLAVDGDEDNFEYLVPLSSLDEGEVLFYIEVTSKEIKKPLNDITSVLDKKGHLGYVEIDDISNKLMELFIESKLDFKSSMVHLHTSMYNLIRSTSDIYNRPDFSKPVTAEDYEILTIKDSIYNNGSVLVSISFERLGLLLKKPSMYYRAVKSSYLDPMFYEKM